MKYIAASFAFLGPWAWLIVIPLIGFVAVAVTATTGNVRKQDQANAEIDELWSSLTKEQQDAYRTTDAFNPFSEEYRIALDNVQDSTFGDERRQIRNDIYLKNLRKYVNSVKQERYTG